VWHDLPAPPAQRGRRQLVGASAVLGVLVLVLGVRYWASSGDDAARLAPAFEHLEAASTADVADRAAHLEDAEVAFRRGIGAVFVQPLALIGLSLIEPMRTELGRPVPAAPDMEGLSDRAALEHTHQLLRRGHPEHALTWLDRLRRARQPDESLQRIQIFAEMWRAARKHPQTPPGAASDPAR